METVESTNKGGGGGLVVSIGSSSLSEESDEPDSLLLLPLEDDPELLEDIGLFPFPFPPIGSAFLSCPSSVSFLVVVETDGISLGGGCGCGEWPKPSGRETISVGTVAVVTVALGVLFVDLLTVCLLLVVPLTVCFLAPVLLADPAVLETEGCCLGLLVTGPEGSFEETGLKYETQTRKKNRLVYKLQTLCMV